MRELASFYPEAKIILTIRNAVKWFESTKDTIHSLEFARFIKNSLWGEMMQKTVYDTMNNRMQDKEYTVAFFENRTQEIINTIAPERLLVYQVKQGWGPLCEFLDIPVPDMDSPRVNSRDETRELLAGMFAANEENPTDEAMSAAAGRLHAENPEIM